jgi:hypothetical protein
MLAWESAFGAGGGFGGVFGGGQGLVALVQESAINAQGCLGSDEWPYQGFVEVPDAGDDVLSEKRRGHG